MKFGSHGASTMIAKKHDAPMRLNEKMNFLFISVHSIVHWKNLAGINATKFYFAECCLHEKILLNSPTMHLKN